MTLFKKLLGRAKEKVVEKPVLERQKRDPERYAIEREKARSKNAKDRLNLAKNPSTHLEILYYLAEDQDTKVRRAVAANPSTPVHVSEVLAADADVDVKIALIKRLGGLLPDLSKDQYAHLYAFAAQALGILALDEVLKVRLALSSALRDETFAPPEVVSQLARDLERQVSEPILKLCTAVPDDVLIEILEQHPDDWVVEAIAGRHGVSGAVSSAVIDTKNVKGGRALIQNDSARLDDYTIDRIVNRAKETVEWHRPLALQTHLPARVIKEIISFVDRSVQKIILSRSDMDELTRKDLTETVSRRINFLVDGDGNRINPKEKVMKLHKAGQLDDEAVRDALALREYDVVYYTLAVKSGVPLHVVKKMIATSSAKAVTALGWKAGMEMRTALEIQKNMAKIQPRELLYPRNGDQYPMSNTDMEWQINFFTDEV